MGTCPHSPLLPALPRSREQAWLPISPGTQGGLLGDRAESEDLSKPRWKVINSHLPEDQPA